MIQKHLHLYERSRTNKEIYRCISPVCTHFTKRELLINKRATCSKCKIEEFTIENSQLNAGQKKSGNKMLVCLKCSKSPKKKEKVEILGKFENMLGDIFKEEQKMKFGEESEKAS